MGNNKQSAHPLNEGDWIDCNTGQIVRPRVFRKLSKKLFSWLSLRLRKKYGCEAYFSRELDGEYAMFRYFFGNPKSVFYPCCGFDYTAAKSFSLSDVVIMDNDPLVETVMARAGINQFVLGDAKQYSPKTPFDLLILLNSYVGPEPLLPHLSVGGYVLANDWTRSASKLRAISGCCELKNLGTFKVFRKGALN